MAKVIITIFDNADGTFQMDNDFLEAFDKESHAHRFGVILLKAADQLAANLGFPEEAATIEELAGAESVQSASNEAKVVAHLSVVK